MLILTIFVLRLMNVAVLFIIFHMLYKNRVNKAGKKPCIYTHRNNVNTHKFIVNTTRTKMSEQQTTKQRNQIKSGNAQRHTSNHFLLSQ